MVKLNISILNSLEEMLLESTRLQDVIRWKKYVNSEEAMKENSLQHSYKAALLALKVLENEKKYSEKPFDAYLVLKAIILHDLGEIEAGDTVYIDKNEEGEKHEYNFFRQLTSSLPEHIKKELHVAYHLQYSNKPGFSDTSDKLNEEYPMEAKLFEAIERIGYVIFAYREYVRRNKEKIFVQVLRNQHTHLVNLAKELPGFGKIFYTEEMQHNIDEFLKGYDGKYIEQKGE